MQKLTALGITLACAAWCAAPNQYVQHNLISDLPGMADHVDPCLINAWGIAASPTSPFWISDNGSGLSTLYNGNGTASSVIVSIPGPAGTQSPAQQCGTTTRGAGAPTGVIFNDTTSFAVGASPASFIFASEDGVISGWNSAANKAAAVMADRSAAGAVYKGLATATRSEGPLLYAADFANARVDLFDGNMNLLSLPGAFRDPQLPAGFAPFNIANLGGTIYVAYAKQDPEHHDDVAGAGNGYIDMYDLNGLLLGRLVSGGPLNSPWGIAVAPPRFGAFGGALLVGNFGDGAINAFDPVTGMSLGALQDGKGAPIRIPGLWGLMFGNGASGGDANTLYFTAGIAGPGKIEEHGLLGTIQPAPTIGPNSVVNGASFAGSISPGAFTAIFGNALAATNRTWTAADLANGRLPTQLDGVSVTIDGKPAYIYFVSPGQIDVIAPADSTSGEVQVVVTNNGLTSATSAAAMQSAAPAFFAAGKYVIATHADGSLVGTAAVAPGATPAKPGETIAIYGTGFGATNPPMDGMVVASPANLATAASVLIGGASAAVTFSGLSAAGLNQINVTIPSLPAGSSGVVDVSVVGTAGTFSTQAGLLLSIQSGN
jgi:uncharacterized protein (TIGR03118 family)